MKTLKRILVITSIVILICFSVAFVYILSSGPALPEDADEITESVLNNPLPELIKGETGFANSQGLDIWYESISPKDSSKGVILLIMGISNDAFGWRSEILQTFVDSGYQVIRYDHRGTGMSDWIKKWKKKNSYSLADMAADGMEVLNALGIEKANLIGISMGGMIAQEMAINYPDKVLSLTSMSSSGYIEDPTLPPISAEIALKLIREAIKYKIKGGDKNMIKFQLAARIILRGDTKYELPVREIAEQVLYNMRKRNGYNPVVSVQHQAAVHISGSRYEKLQKLNLPVLVIHGKQDPFIPYEHGLKTASTIPDADTLWLENMGHDIPEQLLDTISNRIIRNIGKGVRVSDL